MSAAPPPSWTPWAPRLVAVAVSAPILLPGAMAYLDNGPHLAELHLLATEVLPQDRWFTGWTEAVEAGTAVGQLNAPLVWTPLAALMALGLPAQPLYALAVIAAHLVFVEGVRRFAGRLGATEVGAMLAAVLAVCTTPELIGVGGALAGMWPYRLGLGLWALGAGHPRLERNAGAIGLWLAAVLLTHTFAGGLAFGWAAISLLAARPLRQAGAWAGGLLLAVGIASPFLYPLLDPALRRFGAQPAMALPDLLAYAAFPLRPMELIAGRGWSWEGGPAALVACALTFLGMGFALGRPTSPLWNRLAVAAVGVIGVIGVASVTATDTLGPNPWRYAAFVHLAWAVAGGVGLGLRVGPRLAGGVASGLGLLTTVLVVQALPRPDAAVLADAEAAWTSLPPGRAWLEDPAFDPAAPAGLDATHLGALAVPRGHEILGTWYGVNPIPTSPWLSSEGPLTMGQWPGGLAANADALHQRFRLFGVVSIVAYSADLVGVLSGDPRYVPLATHGPFRVYTLREAPPAIVGVPPAAGRVTDVVATRGHITAELLATAAQVPLRVRVAWHPWWTATLNGDPLPLVPGKGDGLVSAVLPSGGRLELRWADPTRWTAALALAATVLAGMRVRRST